MSNVSFDLHKAFRQIGDDQTSFFRQTELTFAIGELANS